MMKTEREKPGAKAFFHGQDNAQPQESDHPQSGGFNPDNSQPNPIDPASFFGK